MLLLGAPIDAPITKQPVPSLEAVFLSDAGILELEQPPQSLREQCPGRTHKRVEEQEHLYATVFLHYAATFSYSYIDYTEG